MQTAVAMCFCLIPIATCAGQSVVAVLDAQPLGVGRVELKLALLNAGRSFDKDGEVELQFLAGEERLEQAEPGLRTSRDAVQCSAWKRDQVEVLRFGPYEAGEDTPERVEVRGGLVGDPAETLGTLVRGERGSVLERPCDMAEGERAICAVALCEAMDPERFLIRVAYLNCGEAFDRDYWAFLHFEPEPSGENLSVTSAMGLHPSGRPTDSASWAADEVTLVTFGPYTTPQPLEAPVYLRVGLYDQAGDGLRVRMAGSGDKERVLVGRLVAAEGGFAFERTVPGEGVAP